MPTYICEKCAREFRQKSGFDDHKTKKIDCAKNSVIDKVVSAKVEQKVKEALRANQKPEITQENLPSFFEDLHNLLWNKAGLSPERALEHMTFFFAYRLIESQADALKLPQECRWTFLASHKNDNDTYETMKRGCMSFQKNKVTKPFFKKPEIDKADIVFEIVQQISRISLNILQETDTLGDIFEYMIGRGMSTMSDEGQYFTNRAICKLAFTLSYDIKKNLRRADGSLCTFADWFCGTGGFPAEFIKGVKANLPTVDWAKDCASVYCQDMNLSSVTTTLLNMLILTGIPFSGDNIRASNSFSEPITNGAGAPFEGLSIDYCFMNPPYGGDKSKGKEYKFAYCKKIKTDTGTSKKYYVNKEIQSIGIEDDDKVSAGVQLAMATLAPDGVCAIVLPQGFFFGTSKKCVELRKKLAETYKIWYVVDIASGSFLNTGTKTSMMVFQKGGVTDNVCFIGLDEKPIILVPLANLRSKHYSLNYKQYMPQSTVMVEGFKIVKLGDIAKKLSTRGKHSAKDTIDNGNYSLFSSSINEIYKLNTFDYPETCCIINSTNASGNAVVNLGREFSVTSDTFVFKCEHDLTTKYLQLYLSNNIQIVKDQFQGANHKHPTWDRLASINIPLPTLESQQEIIDAIDGWVNLAKHETQALHILEKQMMFQVKEMGKGHERVKLGDICDFQRGKPLAKKDFVMGEIPVIGGGVKPVGTHNVHNRESYSILISQSGTAGHISRYTEPVWASDCFSLEPKFNILMDYLYYSVMHLQEAIDFLKMGTAQPHVYPNTIQHLEIPLPPLTEQQTLQSDFDEIRHKHAKITSYKAKAQEAIQRLIPGLTK